MALFGHQTELFNYSSELLASKNTQLATSEKLKQKINTTKEKLQI